MVFLGIKVDWGHAWYSKTDYMHELPGREFSSVVQDLTSLQKCDSFTAAQAIPVLHDGSP